MNFRYGIYYIMFVLMDILRMLNFFWKILMFEVCWYMEFCCVMLFVVVMVKGLSIDLDYNLYVYDLIFYLVCLD